MTTRLKFVIIICNKGEFMSSEARKILMEKARKIREEIEALPVTLKWKKQLIENGGDEKLYTIESTCGRAMLQKLVVYGQKKNDVAWGLIIDGVEYDDAENVARGKLRAEGVIELVDKGEIILNK